MQWLEVTIQTSSNSIEMVAEQLTFWGFDSFIMEDQKEFHDFLEDSKQYWDYVDSTLEKKMSSISQIRLYFEDGPFAADIVDDLRNHLQVLSTQYPKDYLGTLAITLENCMDEDWENNWKTYYHIIPVGEKLQIVPCWLEPDPAENRIPVLLDPGMIFGTGAHASTKMCLAALEKLIHGGEAVVDLGSGSGILSISALLLGASHAIGVDIDPKAESIARSNAAINHLSDDKFTAMTGNVITDSGLITLFSKTKFDIVLANIVADVILPLSKMVPQFLNKNGRFICSGILDQRLEEVCASIEHAGMIIEHIQTMEDWCQVTAVR